MKYETRTSPGQGHMPKGNVIMVLVTLLSCSIAGSLQSLAAGSDKNRPAESPTELYKRLTKEWDSLGTRWNERMQKATELERKTLRIEMHERYRTVSQECSRQLIRLAKENPDDPVAIDSLLWVVRNANALPVGAQAAEEVIRNHLENPRVVEFVLGLGRWIYPTDEPLLRALADRASQPEATGVAKYRLANTLLTKSTWSRQLQDDSTGTLVAFLGEGRAMGPELVAHLNSCNSELLAADAKRLFEEIRASFSDVKHSGVPIGESVNAKLNEMRNLRIGHTAPGIEGEDIDGKPFKLSDYRGNVIVLNFWGHW